MDSSIQTWVEVEPGAPLPPEAPPWAERHELVMRPELSEPWRRATLAAAVAMLAASAAAVIAGSPLGYAGVLPGVVFLYAGLTGGPKHPVYIPSSDGPYVAIDAPPEPRDPAELAKARKLSRMFDLLSRGIGVSVVLCFVASGFFTLRELGIFVLAIAAGGSPLLVEAVKRRLKSEAEVSERFLAASDPRNPLPIDSADAGALPAGAEARPDLGSLPPTRD